MIILKLIGLFFAGFAINYSLTTLAAPGHGETAFLVGFLLITFGMAVAAIAMQIVVLPLGVLHMILRALGSQSNKNDRDTKKDPWDGIGRALFILIYAFISMCVGIYIGFQSDGWGIFTTAFAFGGFALVLAWFTPLELIWSVDTSDTHNNNDGMSDAEKAQWQELRAKGDPSAKLLDKITKFFLDLLRRI